MRPSDPRRTDFCHWRAPLQILHAQLRKVGNNSRLVPTASIIFTMIVKEVLLYRLQYSLEFSISVHIRECYGAKAKLIEGWEG